MNTWVVDLGVTHLAQAQRSFPAWETEKASELTSEHWGDMLCETHSTHGS